MAIKNFLDSYLEYAKKTIPIPDLYNKWGGVMAVSAMLGKRLWITRGHLNIFPNMYIMLMGEPGTGKGIACDICQGILQNAGYELFAADRSSKEKFLQDLSDGISFNQPTGMDSLLANESTGAADSLLSSEPRECFVLAEEFSDFLGQNNADFVAFLTKIWSFRGTYRYRLKTGRSVGITEPYISILGGSSSSAFSLTFPPEIVAQGFLARLVLVGGEWTGARETWPETTESDFALGQSCSDFLRGIRDNVNGQIFLNPQAYKDLELLDKSFGGVGDPRFRDYNIRRFTQLLKLCIISAASRGDSHLRIEDVERADNLLCETEYLMPKALGSFGKSKNADTANKILQYLFTATRPATTMQLWKIVCDDLDKLQDLTDILHKLSSASRIQAVDGGWLPRFEAKIERALPKGESSK